MKDYIVQEDGDEELFIEEQDHGNLTTKSQSTVCKHIFGFIKRHYTLSATSNDIVQVCKAAVELFGSLKAKNSAIDGIVSSVCIIYNVLSLVFTITFPKDLLYHPTDRKGFFSQKMRYGKRTKHAKENAVLPKRTIIENDNDAENEFADDVEETSNDNNDSDENIQIEAFSEVAEALISFIQTCVLPHDVNKIKKKFEETIEVRRKMMMKLDEYKQLFDLYLVCPSLVSFFK